MATKSFSFDWSVTGEKVAELLRRIIETADPLQIRVFGSRARGNHKPDSDLDIVAILDSPEEQIRDRLPYTVTQDIGMDVDMLVVSKDKFDEHRPWLNSVYNYIDREGIVLYDRDYPECARPYAVHTSPGGRIYTSVSAA